MEYLQLDASSKKYPASSVIPLSSLSAKHLSNNKQIKLYNMSKESKYLSAFDRRFTEFQGEFSTLQDFIPPPQVSPDFSFGTLLKTLVPDLVL